MYNKIKIALYSLLSTVNISFVGSMRVSEVLVMLWAPFVYDRRDFTTYPYLRKIVMALLLLLFFQVVTDIVVGTAPADYFRGWASILVSLLSFIVLFKLFNSYEGILLYVGMVMLRNIFYTDDIVDSDMSYFKFKMVPILSSLVYLLCAYFYRRGNIKAVLGVLLGYALTCVSFDSRSTAVVFFISAIIIYFFNSGLVITRAKLIVFSILAAGFFQVAYIFYVDAVLANDFGGEHARAQLQRLENPYNPFELLMTGRGETFAAATAIADAPVFGHGSWAKDHTLKYYQILLMFHDEELNLEKAYAKDQLIPSHSILMGAWINCGVGGFLAVALLFGLLMKVGFYMIRNAQEVALYPVIVLMTIGLIWTFAFSPFQHLRFSVPATGAILLSTYYDFVYGEAPEPEPPAMLPPLQYR
ncbi:hypothetical protein [Chitinophaga alhagiae]|uniref:hypothetical protein n=1 Tax=Chitinophaga alhagiae TaxID=2203219 RepID=UPI000E5C2618|nr:hypothetical protein [Chitinophaga alhagiae]